MNHTNPEFTVTHGLYVVTTGALPMQTEEPDAHAESILRPGSAPEYGVGVYCGTFWGPVHLTVEVHDSAPEPLRESEWERIEEVAATAGEGRVQVHTLDGDSEFPAMAVTPGGQYHVRVGVRGWQAGLERPEGSGRPADEVHYLQLWPN